MHECFARTDVDAVTREAALIEYDRRWYSTWMERALGFFADEDPPASRQGRNALRWLADRYDQVVDRLTALSATVIHGEFYPSNVLVLDGDDERRVCPVDWEMTATGPGIIDLAALTLGRWREGDRRAVITAYANAVGGSSTATMAETFDAVMLAQIHLSVQWLGWFGHHQPPAEHCLDYLSDAIDRAEALRL
jgi:Ser/Thr protein kinase RdoA (MazF antagonist)